MWYTIFIDPNCDGFVSVKVKFIVVIIIIDFLKSKGGVMVNQ